MTSSGYRVNYPEVMKENSSIPELPEKLAPCTLLQLPFAHNRHIVPNVCLQSALFGMVIKGQRKFVNGQVVASFSSISVKYTGEQLDQGDLDVFIHAIHITAQKEKESFPEGLVQFSVRGFLKAIDRKPGKSGQQWLLNSIRRLSASNVEIQFTNKSYFDMFSIYGASLINDYFYDPVKKKYYLRVNSCLGTLFERGWTPLCWKERLQLTGQLTKWLHGLYSSTETYPIKVSSLHRLSGSRCKRITDFRRSLKVSFKELVQVGAIKSWRIDQSDKVHVVNNRKDR